MGTDTGSWNEKGTEKGMKGTAIGNEKGNGSENEKEDGETAMEAVKGKGVETKEKGNSTEKGKETGKETEIGKEVDT